MHVTHKSIKVNIRLRKLGAEANMWTASGSTIFSTHGGCETSFVGFTNVMPDVTNLQVYNACVREDVQRFLGFENCTVFAYGQTGSGKTHTMLGSEEEGIIKLALREILSTTSATISYLEIYNEKLYDLATGTEVQIFSVGNRNHISNLHAEKVSTWEQAQRLIDRCEKNRRYGTTEFNDKSSRSHTIFQISIGSGPETWILNMIDLAGSERASRSSERRKEGAYINRSLLALCTIVNNMSQGRFAGFRDSKLTRVLQSSMDGATNLVAICMLSPHAECMEESVSTLKFAARLSNLDLKCSTRRLPPQPELYCTCSLKKRIADTEFLPDDMKPADENKEGQKNRDSTAMEGGRCMEEFNEKLKLSCARETSVPEDVLGGARDTTESLQLYREMVYNCGISSSITGPFKALEDGQHSSISRPFGTEELRSEVTFLMEVSAMQQERIASLESMLSDLLSKHPSRKLNELFILEKHMYNLRRRMVKKR
jgi:centromeric protein E